MATSNDDKLDAMIEHLTERHLNAYGGYPYDCEWFGDVLVVATLDNSKDRNRTLIETYQRARLIRWHDLAVRFAKGEGCDVTEALYETEVTAARSAGG